ncbi:MAG: histidine phosphatase family protein [Myxococcales bacterium]|nr:histidine phosphatase family protein [Myxococcales bacterium]
MGNLYLVRHGQASAFEDNYDRLSSLGERQARLLGESWRRRGLKFHRVFTGPRVRQKTTAEIAAEAGGLPAPVELADLDEMGVEPLFREHMPDLFARHAHLQSLGDAMLMADGDEARARSFARLFEAVLQVWVRGDVRAAGVEAWLEFRARVRRVLATVRAEARGQRIAVFTSAGPVAAAVQHALGTDDDGALALAFRVRNSSFSEFLFSGERFSLASFNETPHLEDAALLTVR